MDDFERLTPEELKMFSGPRTTLEEIKAAGWDRYHSSSGNWWWKHRETSRKFMPWWVRLIEAEAEERGQEEIRGILRSLVEPRKP